MCAPARVRWIFHTIPRPGEFGYDTWPPDAYKTARSARIELVRASRSTKRAASFTSPTEDGGAGFLGRRSARRESLRQLPPRARRHHGQAALALPDRPSRSARQGPAVPAGAARPSRTTAKRSTRWRKARSTACCSSSIASPAQPLWPIEERPVPQSDLPGEQTWPTQPFPTKPAPLMRQHYTASDVSTISPDGARLTTLSGSGARRTSAPFPPPSLEGNDHVSRLRRRHGMGRRGGRSRRHYYVNVNEIPWLYQMVETRRADGTPLSPRRADYLMHCARLSWPRSRGQLRGGFPSLDRHRKPARPLRADRSRSPQTGRRAHAAPSIAFPRAARSRSWITVLRRRAAGDRRSRAGRTQRRRRGRARSTPIARRMPSPDSAAGSTAEGYPAIKPPWGTLNAVDLNTGEIKWKVPLGEYPELTARGIPPTGTENYGGPVVTAGGLIFIGATADETFRAFDKETGTILWQAKLPFGGNATPSTYMVNGRQSTSSFRGRRKIRPPRRWQPRGVRAAEITNPWSATGPRT